MSPVAVLVGLPGVGKTTAGKRLANRLKVPFADSDQLVEQRTGSAVPTLFAQQGEAAFRAIEADVVRAALVDFGGVLALGGGAIRDAGTRAALHDSGCPVVLLTANLRTLRRRVGSGDGRPLLAGDPSARLAALAAEREPLYAEVRTHEVVTDGRSSSRVAAEIAELLTAVPR